MDVRLDDEVAELRCHDAVVRGAALVGGVGSVGFPSFEDGAEFVLAAEEADAVPAIAHAGFEDPPLTIRGGQSGVVGEALVELVGFEESLVEEVGVVELEVEGWLDVVFERAGRVFGEPRGDGVREEVFSDEGFAD